MLTDATAFTDATALTDATVFIGVAAATDAAVAIHTEFRVHQVSVAEAIASGAMGRCPNEAGREGPSSGAPS
ncbi:hypothetical protein [Streptomyces phaeochromogenes]